MRRRHPGALGRGLPVGTGAGGEMLAPGESRDTLWWSQDARPHPQRGSGECKEPLVQLWELGMGLSGVLVHRRGG